MLDAHSRPLRSGEATYHARWVSNGVEYDSDHYGAPLARIDSKGWACFEGGVGPTAVVRKFELKSLTVQVTDGAGNRFRGSASNIRYRYYSNTQELDASARFVLSPPSMVDESAEPDAGAIVIGARVMCEDQCGERKEH
jgi:hypothetical protein